MSCSDVCVYMGEGESADFYRESTPRAAKPYRCEECRAEIAKGETHHYASMKFDGEFMTVRTCLACHEIRTTFCCEGWTFGQVWEAIADQIFREWNEITAIDCLARLKTDAAIAKMRAEYARYLAPPARPAARSASSSSLQEGRSNG